MSHVPMLKIIGLAATVVTHYYATTPPIPPPAREEKVSSGSAKAFEIVLPWLRFGTVIALSLAVLSEIVVIAALAHPTIASVPPSVYHTLCPRPSHNASNLQSIPPQFWLGLLLATTGCALRVWCYKTLGTLFTYELSLRPTHTLIRTAPYNIVRHPSYTGLFLHFTGVALLHFSPGGWDRECGITTETKSGPWILLWLGLSAYTFVSVWRRGAVEDRLMQKRFGEVWEQYARDVPCKFFPGVV